MADERLILCGGAAPPGRRGRAGACPPLRLAIGRGRRDVHLGLARLSRDLLAGVPDVEADLLELAAYVYAADQALTRGGTKEFEYGERWRRRLRFAVAVRRPEVWNRPAVAEALRAALGFLTDDEYEFGFVRAEAPARPDRYLTDALPAPADPEFEEVVLFSGGLDSLAGAVDEVLAGQRRVVLVSHRPENRVFARQQGLVAAIRSRAPSPRLAPYHFAAVVNKGKVHNREFTQRSRSFLFAAMAAVVARLFGLDRVRFYENGVTSLNLPVSPQMIGGRASRTTHPQTLARFERLFSLLFDARFGVENPYQWLTKAQVLGRLKAAGHADLAARTSSCVHTRTRTDRHPHCGLCSQCVDRRVTALAAGLSDAEDPPGGYESDVLTGERDGVDLTFVERYVGTALDLEGVATPVRFAARYGEVNQVLPYAGRAADDAAAAVFALYRRHACDVRRVVREALAARAGDLLRQAFPARSLLGAVVGRAARAPGRPVAAPTRAGRPAGLAIDPKQFEVRWGDGPPCFLGNTKEFYVVGRLARTPGEFVLIAALAADVWAGVRVAKNTVQRTVSNARRKLARPGFEGVVIDGDQRGHYRLTLPR